MPFSILYAVTWLVFHIYYAVVSPAANSYDAEAANFAMTFLEGLFRIMITIGIIRTMELPETAKIKFSWDRFNKL